MLARGWGAYEVRCHGCGVALHVLAVVDEIGLPLGAEAFEIGFAVDHEGHVPQPVYESAGKSCNAAVIDLRGPTS